MMNNYKRQNDHHIRPIPKMPQILDTDLSDEDVDSTSDSSNMTIVPFTQESLKNSSHGCTQVSSSKITTSSLNHDDGIKHRLHPFDDIKQATKPLVAAEKNLSDFNKFRLQYLVVHAAIMLADGLQGKNELSITERVLSFKL